MPEPSRTRHSNRSSIDHRDYCLSFLSSFCRYCHGHCSQELRSIMRKPLREINSLDILLLIITTASLQFFSSVATAMDIALKSLEA